MVRALQANRAHHRRAGNRICGPHHHWKDGHRLESQGSRTLSGSRHSDAAAVQGRPGRRIGHRPRAQGRAEESDRQTSLMAATRNVVVIGSGPAGLTAALYSARANLKPLVIEGIEAGGQLMLTTMVENYPGYRDGIMGPDLMSEMREQAKRFGAEFVHGNVEKVELCGAYPFKVKTVEAEHAAKTIIV